MGTSTPFGGGKNGNPLIPSWVEDGDAVGDDQGANPPAPDNAADTPTSDGPAGPDAELAGDAANPPPPAQSRFQSARRNFNAFAKSGGRDRGSLGRAVGSYVRRTGGGARRTAQRMASERGATARLGGILMAAGDAGIREVVRRLDLAHLVDRPVEELYAALVDVICQPGGDLDESFARDAYIEALAEILALGVEDLERPSLETITSFLGAFMTSAIQDRILNAIGNRVVVLPLDIAAVQAIEGQLRDFIRGAVNDALAEAGGAFPVDRMSETIDGLYERALTILEAYAEVEAEAEAA